MCRSPGNILLTHTLLSLKEQPETAFQHLAMEVSGEEATTEWEEPVDAADYDRLNESLKPVTMW